MTENRVRFVIEAKADNATKVLGRTKGEVRDLKEEVSLLKAALDDFSLFNASAKINEIKNCVKKLPLELSGELLGGYIGEEIGPPIKWLGKLFGMAIGHDLEMARFQADYSRQVEEAKAKEEALERATGGVAEGVLMKNIGLLPSHGMQDIGLLPSHGAQTGLGAMDDGAVQTTKQAVRDIAVVTEQARDSLIETREIGLGVYDEWLIAQDKWIESQNKAVQAAIQAGNDFANGWRAGLNEYVRDATNTFAQAERLAQTTAQSMSQGFSDFFFDAMQGQIKGFEDYLNSFVVSVQRAVADMAAQRVTGSMISGIGGLFSAKGNVFSHGQVVPFASGGVVAGPTMFPLGLMGEAGPEAILPLQRTRSGALGVKAEGGGGDVVNNYFALNISAMDTRSMSQAFEQHKRQIVGMVQEAYNKRGKRGPVG